MRISKFLSFVMIAAITTAVTTASASSACNSRSGVSRQASTNPEKRTASKSSSLTKKTKAGHSSSRHGKK